MLNIDICVLVCNISLKMDKHSSKRTLVSLQIIGTQLQTLVSLQTLDTQLKNLGVPRLPPLATYEYMDKQSKPQEI